MVFHFVKGFCDLDASALASPAGMDLGFYRPGIGAPGMSYFFCRFDRSVRGIDHHTLRNGYIILLKDGFSLVFMYIHTHEIIIFF